MSPGSYKFNLLSERSKTIWSSSKTLNSFYLSCEMKLWKSRLVRKCCQFVDEQCSNSLSKKLYINWMTTLKCKVKTYPIEDHRGSEGRHEDWIISWPFYEITSAAKTFYNMPPWKFWHLWPVKMIYTVSVKLRRKFWFIYTHTKIQIFLLHCTILFFFFSYNIYETSVIWCDWHWKMNNILWFGWFGMLHI